MPFIDPKPGKWVGTLDDNISPFDRGCPPERDDVGIVPYIPSGVHTIQPGCKYSAPVGAATQPPERYRNRAVILNPN